LPPGKILIPGVITHQQETLARVHPKVMWAKFEALAAGARLATAELQGSGGRLGVSWPPLRARARFKGVSYE
jgi:hypothetical protein